MKHKNKKGQFLIMVLSRLGTSLLRNLLGSKGTIRAGKAQLELARILNAASSFNKFWNAKVLPKWT